MLQPLHFRDEPTFVDLAARATARCYPETGEPYVAGILQDSLQVGATTTEKRVLGLYRRGELLGFTVVTEKTGGRAKLGPTVVLPRHRGRSVGVVLRKYAQAYCALRGVAFLYSTCPADDAAVRSYVTKSGALYVARLRGHYRSRRSELVFCNVLGPYAPAIADVTEDAVFVKRGGGVRVAVTPATLHSLPALASLFERPDIATARRVYMIAPAAAGSTLHGFGFSVEGLYVPGGQLVYGRITKRRSTHRNPP